MSVKDHLAGITAQITGTSSGASVIPKRERGSGSVGAPVQLAQFSADYQDLERKVTDLEANKGRALRLRLDLCDDGPYHASPIEPERVKSLKANLEQNGQSAPALLRAKAGGRYEIIAGRHRKVALLELGHEEWDVVIKDIDDDLAERVTFYDNLLAPSLSDYAKYLGFAQRKHSKKLTLEQLSLESGVSKTHVARLLSFGNLPESALESIAQSPNSVGSRLVEALAGLTPQHSERVAEAVKMVIAGTLPPQKAVEWVIDKKRPESNRSAETIIRSGNATFAKMTRREGRLFINFANTDQATIAEKAVEALLQKMAESMRPTKSGKTAGTSNATKRGP